MENNMYKEKKHREMVTRARESEEQRIRADKKPDEDLMQTFPASDPISYSKPGNNS
jgi:hypothetical protein